MQSLWIAGLMTAVCLCAQIQPASAQATPPENSPRVGHIFDLTSEPTLSGIEFHHVTLNLDSVPAKQAVQMLSQISPAPITVAGAPVDMEDQPVTIHLKDGPFLEALFEFRHQAHASLRTYTTDSIAMSYVTPEEGMPLWCVAGPFAVTLQGITRDVISPSPARGAPLPPRNESTSRAILHMGFFNEPGINIIQSMQAITFDSLTDDKNQPIATDPGRNLGGFSATQGQSAQVTLTLPPSPGRVIPVLKGHVAATLAKSEKVESQDLTAPHTQQVNGMTLEIGPITPRNGSNVFFSVIVKYTRGDFPQEKWADMVALLPKAKSTVRSGAARGGNLNASATGNGNRAGDTLQVTYNVTVSANAGPATAFALDVPIEVKEIQVPFEFHDLILP